MSSRARSPCVCSRPHPRVRPRACLVSLRTERRISLERGRGEGIVSVSVIVIVIVSEKGRLCPANASVIAIGKEKGIGIAMIGLMLVVGSRRARALTVDTAGLSWTLSTREASMLVEKKYEMCNGLTSGSCEEVARAATASYTRRSICSICIVATACVALRYNRNDKYCSTNIPYYTSV